MIDPEAIIAKLNATTDQRVIDARILLSSWNDGVHVGDATKRVVRELIRWIVTSEPVALHPDMPADQMMQTGIYQALIALWEATFDPEPMADLEDAE